MATFEFRKQLFFISNQLSSSDVENLKFLCIELISRRELERVHTGFDLFAILEGLGRLSINNLAFLEELLCVVHKDHLLRQLKDSLYNAGGDNRPPRAIRGDHRNRALTAKCHQFLVRLGSNLTETNVRDMAYFLRNYNVKALNAQLMEKISEPAKLFDILMREGVISPVDLSSLKDVLEALGRLDLCTRVEEYTQSVQLGVAEEESQAGNSSVALSKPVEAQENAQHYGYPTMATGDSISSDVFSHCSDDSYPSDVGEQLLSDNRDTGSREGANRSTVMLVGANCLTKRQGAQRTSGRTRTQLLQLELNEKMQQLQRAERDAGRDEVRSLNVALERKNQEVQELATEISELRERLLTTEDEELYPMKNYPHGKAIVIVNENFHTNPDNPNLKLSKRRGAQQDLEHYKKMVQALGYDVTAGIKYDLTAYEMYTAIVKVAEESHKAFDSFICCISTHGDEQFMYGSDSVEVNRGEFLQPLKNCVTLFGKPKMFFIQACRNKVETSTATRKPPVYYPEAASKDADLFIANATTAQNSSYRTPNYGSWFVYALHHIFTTYADRNTLSQMMSKVNNAVSDRRGELCVENQGKLSVTEVQQCAEYTTSFRMGLRFMKRHPPYSTHN